MVLLSALFAALPESQPTALEYNRDALTAGEWWRLWTGHFVHFSPRHASVDLLALCGLVFGMELRGKGGVAAALLLCLPPLLSLGLYFAVPELLIYRGASGLCAAFATALGLELWRESKRSRPMVCIVTALFLVKSTSEIFGTPVNFSGLGDGVRVVWQVHLLGALLALLIDRSVPRNRIQRSRKVDRTFKKIVMWSSDSIC